VGPMPARGANVAPDQRQVVHDRGSLAPCARRRLVRRVEVGHAANRFAPHRGEHWCARFRHEPLAAAFDVAVDAAPRCATVDAVVDRCQPGDVASARCRHGRQRSRRLTARHVNPTAGASPQQFQFALFRADRRAAAPLDVPSWPLPARCTPSHRSTPICADRLTLDAGLGAETCYSFMRQRRRHVVAARPLP